MNDPSKISCVAHPGTCKIPISGHFTIDAQGHVTSTFEYAEIPARQLAILLIRGFGLDVDDLYASRRP